MTMDVRRSTHPDLLDELEAQLPASSSQPADGSVRARRRRNGASPPASAVPPPGDTDTAPPDAPEGGSDEAPVAPSEPAVAEIPEWLTALRAVDDPKEILALVTRNVSREDLARDEIVSGLIGGFGETRARKILEDQERQRTERARAEAYDKGDLYTLGQLTAADLQAQRELLEQQRQATANPYMIGITQFQQGLPEAVQREVQGKNYDNFQAYLQAVHESRLRHELEDEVRKREPALRKAELSATVGSEMTPELEGGPAQAYREITDAQVSAMTLEEYDRYFDDKGRPRPGVRVSLTRGIDVRREQRR